MAVSFAVVTFVCGLWSVGVVTLLPVCPLVCGCVHHLLFPCPGGAGSLLRLVRLGARFFQDLVFLADILLPQLWSATVSSFRLQLSIENGFLDAAVLQALHMTKQTQSALSEKGVRARKVSDLSFLSRYAQGAVDEVEGVEFSPVWHRRCSVPSLYLL